MKKILIAIVVLGAGCMVAQSAAASSYYVWASGGSSSYGYNYSVPYSYYSYTPYYSSYGGYFGGAQIAYNQFFSGYGTYRPTSFHTNAVRVVGSSGPSVVVTTGSGVNVTSGASGTPIPAPVTGQCASGIYQYNVCVVPR